MLVKVGAASSGGCCRLLLLFIANERREDLVMGRAYLATLPRWGGIVVLTIALGLPAFTSQAGEIIAKGRNITHSVKSEWTEVSEGHVIGFFEAAGIGLHEDGQITTIENKGSFDSIKGNSASKGYMTKTFTDGSTYSSSWQGTSKRAGDHKIYEGTWQYAGGTGRYVGVKGEGTYSGRSYGKMTVIDFEGKTIIPEQ